MNATQTRPRFNLTAAMTSYRTDSGKLAERRTFADDGAVTQQGPKPMFNCDCGARVVWLKSTRTGRSYLAECSQYANLTDRYRPPTFFYNGRSVHTHDRHAELIEHGDRRARAEVEHYMRERAFDNLRDLVDLFADDRRPFGWLAGRLVGYGTHLLAGADEATRDLAVRQSMAEGWVIGWDADGEPYDATFERFPALAPKAAQ